MTVTVLGREDCSSCEQAKELLARLAPEYGLEVRVMDFNSPEGERLALSGGLMFPPGILIEGQPFSYGRLSEGKLRRELERRSQQGAPPRRPNQGA